MSEEGKNKEEKDDFEPPISPKPNESDRSVAFRALKKASEDLEDVLDLVYWAEGILQGLRDEDDYAMVFAMQLAELDKMMKHVKERIEWIKYEM